MLLSKKKPISRYHTLNNSSYTVYNFRRVKLFLGGLQSGVNSPTKTVETTEPFLTRLTKRA